MELNSKMQPRVRATRRKMVVVSTYFLTLLLPLVVIVMICLPFSRWLTSTANQNQMILVLVAIVVVYIASATISRLAWTILMSFYLSVDEFRVIASVTSETKKIPFLSPIYQQFSKWILDWKIGREQ